MSTPHSSSPARCSPTVQREFRPREGFIIDTQDFPSPFSINFDTNKTSKMTDELHLIPSFPVPTSKKAKRVAIASEFLPGDVHRRISIISNGSIPSDPGMIEDSHGWSDSDTSFDDERNHRQTPDEIWDSFWTTNEPQPVKSKSRSASPASNVSTPTAVTGLRRREGHQSSSRRPAPLQNISSNYSAFPEQRPATSHRPTTSRPQEPTHVPHKSWPLPTDTPKPVRPSYRTRAYTSPPKPSQLSRCTTSNSASPPKDNSATRSASNLLVETPIYSKSAPITPDTPNFPQSLIELIEKSVFEDDDEDENEKTGLVALAVRLHLRTASNGNSKDTEAKRAQLKKQKKNMRRSAGEALKGVFGMK